MAHFCKKPEQAHCSWRYKGTVVGTDKILCNCFSKVKPCEVNDQSVGGDVDIKPFPESGDINAQDFIDYFGKSREEILSKLKPMKTENTLKQEIFKDATTLGRRGIRDLYTDTEYYTITLNNISEKFFSHLKSDVSNISTNEIVKICNDLFKERAKTKVLDYGCGPGHYGLFLALQGYDVTLMDLPHKAFDFLQCMCKKYGVKVNFAYSPEEYQDIRGKFDYIICSDVLEHVDEPEQLLETLTAHLNDDGCFFLSTFFDDMDGLDPSHLKKNTIRYGNYQEWRGRVLDRGISPVIRDRGGVEKGFFKQQYLERLVRGDKK